MKSVRSKQKEKTRENILNAATEIFFTEGFSSTTTKAISERAGVSKGTIFHHFATKEELGIEVLKLSMSQFVNITDQVDELTLKEFIRKFMKESLYISVKAPGFLKMVLYFMLHYDNKIISKFFKEALIPYVDFFTSLFEKHGVKKPKVKARIVIGLADGLGLQMMYYTFLEDKYRLGTLDEEINILTEEIIELLDINEE